MSLGDAMLLLWSFGTLAETLPAVVSLGLPLFIASSLDVAPEAEGELAMSLGMDPFLDSRII